MIVRSSVRALLVTVLTILSALDFGYFDQKPEELEVFRLQTIDCIYQSVNGVQSTTHGRSLPPPTHPAILSLCDIGTTLGRDSQSGMCIFYGT